MRRILFIDECREGIFYFFIGYWVYQYSQTVELCPGFSKCHSHQIGYQNILLIKSATKYQCNPAAPLQFGSRNNTTPLKLLFYHGTFHKMRPVNGITQLQVASFH